MGFFDRQPPVPRPEPEPAPPRPAWMKPEAVLPGVVPEVILLARSPDAVVAITGLLGYPTGFEFTLTAVLRQEDRYSRIMDPRMFRGLGLTAEPLPDEFLRLGVAFADGRAVTNLGRHWHHHGHGQSEPDPDGPVLSPEGGGGSGRRYDMTYWVWPLPPAGPLTFVCEWPSMEIPESRADLDAALVIQAADRATPLWPGED